MKKLLFLFTILFSLISYSQIVTIPDANFKTVLIEAGVDTNGDGEIQETEAEAITELIVSYSQISSLEGISSFTNLTHLDCCSNALTSLDVSNLSNLSSLNSIDNQISSINISGLTGLTTLSLSGNQLTSLDISGFSNLLYLSYGNNQLPQLDLSNLSKLEYLSCYNNQITQLDLSNLSKLKYLGCSNNLLTQLDLSNLTELEKLYCFDNQLIELGIENSPRLVDLRCSNNPLTQLDLSNVSNLRNLYCNNNQLTQLDLSYVPKLGSLTCSNNQLTSLDLSSLPVLTGIDVNNNLLTSLDVSNQPNACLVYCKDNQLETLNLKNGSIEEELDYSSNPNFQYICADADQREQIQNAINALGYTNCVVNSYCSFEPGGEVYHIQGNTKVDLASNGCDVNDINFPFLQLKVTDVNNNTDIYTANTTGNYNIELLKGTYTIDYQFPYSSYFDVTPPSFTVDFPADTSPFQQDICLTPNGTYNDLQITIIPIEAARPGFDTDYKIVYTNVGTATLSGNVTFTFESDVIGFVNASVTPDSQNTGELSWSFTDLTLFDSKTIDVTMNLNTPTDTPALNGGDILCYNATINPTTNDETISDNSFDLKQTVVNSFDPNDKTCLEGDIITPDLVGEYVHYLIRFENTGSASAVNIVVKDVIDNNKFDLETFVPMTSSHEYITRIQNTNEVEFIFEGINLPFDDATNDGYVAFKIKTLLTLAVGDVFANKAEIYFDYNAPIITNNAQTTIETTAGLDEFSLNSNIEIFPNPASHQLNIESKLVFDSIAIYDLTGRQLNSVSYTVPLLKSKITVDNLTSGIYYISIQSGRSKKLLKFLKK